MTMWVRAAVVVGRFSLAGCSLLNEPWKHQPPHRRPRLPVAAAAGARTAAPGVHARVRTRGDDTVLGVVQLTTVGKEDTLPDIARRFNVGYEEIVRANPGVDPWIPGVGRKVVVPTQFILPNAPHEGVVINLAAMRIFYFPSTSATSRRSSTPTRSASARPAGARPKGSPRSSRARRTRPGVRAPACARSTRRTMIRCPPWCPRAPTIRSASSSSRSAGPST